MKITTEVPIANGKEGKTVTLTLDTSSGEVEVLTPAMLRTPRVELASLQRAVEELGNAPLLRTPAEER